MPMKPAGLLALILSAGMLPTTAAAADGKGTWVFVDNSQSVEEMSKTYAQDLWDMLTLGKPKRILFSAIAPTDQHPWLLDSSDAAGFPDKQRVGATFDFKAKTTPIAASLKRAAERPEFGSVDHLVLISDMDPDHHASGALFHFDEADILDLDETLKTMDDWLGGGKAGIQGRTMDVILHGWQSAPTPTRYSTEELNRFPDTMQAEIAALRKAQRGHKVGPDTYFQEPASQGGRDKVAERRRELVAKGLAWLAVKHQGRLHLSAINTKAADGGLNIEGFKNSLCGVLKADLQDLEICGGGAVAAGADVSNISSRIDVSSLMMRAYLSPRITQNWPTEVYADGMPRTLPPPLVNIGIDQEHGDPILHFRLDGSRAGPQPFNYPVLSATGLTPDRGVVALGERHPDRAMGSKEEMIDWAVGEAREMIEAFVKENYPLQTRLKKIWISDANGQPVPDGLHFLVMYDTGASGPKSRSGESNIAATRGGVVQLRVPARFKSAHLFLTKPDGKVVGSAFDITQQQVEAPRGIEGRLAAAEFKRDQGLLFCAGAVENPEICAAELKGDVDLALYLQTGDKELKPWPLYESGVGTGARLVRNGASLTIQGLVPGAYVMDARVREDKPHWLARTEYPLDPDMIDKGSDKANAIVPLLPDELADGFKEKYFSVEPRGGSFTLDRESRTYLRGSAYYMERLLEHTGEQMATGDQSAQKKLIELWTAVRQEIFGKEGQSTETDRYSRWLAPALAPLDIVAGGRARPGAMDQLLAMFNRYIQCYDQRLDQAEGTGTEFERRYLDMVLRMKQAGVINEPLFMRLIGRDSQCTGR